MSEPLTPAQEADLAGFDRATAGVALLGLHDVEKLLGLSRTRRQVLVSTGVLRVVGRHTDRCVTVASARELFLAMLVQPAQVHHAVARLAAARKGRTNSVSFTPALERAAR